MTDDRLSISTHLSGLLRVLCKNHSALESVSKEVSLKVEELGSVDDLLDLFGLKVRFIELLSGTELGAQRAVVPGDDDGAGTSLSTLDDLVWCI